MRAVSHRRLPISALSLILYCFGVLTTLEREQSAEATIRLTAPVMRPMAAAIRWRPKDCRRLKYRNIILTLTTPQYDFGRIRA